MKIVWRIIKVFLLVVVSIVVLLTIVWYLPAKTPQINSNDHASVSTVEYIEIGGVEQCVLIRSENTNNPILLFLHGGPGMPMMFMAHEFQRPLENDFTVVQWDRRGAGKTYVRNKPPSESINTSQLINDAYELIDTLRNRYDQDRVILVGHSFGTYIGSIMTSERPELFSTYISIGQVVDPARSRVLQEKFVSEQACLAGNEELILELSDTTNKMNLEPWLFEFGGELKNSKSFIPLVWSGMQAPEYTLSEVLKVGEASFFSSSNIRYNTLSGSIHEEILTYQIPTFFFVGASDYTTPHELIADYYELVEAPKKELIYFDNSAHFPFFEEPGRFCDELKRVLNVEKTP